MLSFTTCGGIDQIIACRAVLGYNDFHYGTLCSEIKSLNSEVSQVNIQTQEDLITFITVVDSDETKIVTSEKIKKRMTQFVQSQYTDYQVTDVIDRT